MFDNTAHAMVALFQMSTLDGWSGVMWRGIDVVAEGEVPRRENHYWRGMYFMLFVVFGK